MTRKEIYDRYLDKSLSIFLKVKRKKKKDAIIDGVYYYAYIATDINLVFYIATNIIDSRQITAMGNGVDKITVRCKSEVKGNPVVSYTVSFSKQLDYYNKKFIIDTLECDFSHVVNIEFEFNKKHSQYTGAIFNSDRSLRPVRVKGIFRGLDFFDIEEILKCIDFSELAYANNMFEDTNVEDFNFDNYEIGNLERADAMFKSCFKLKNITGGSKLKLKSAFEMFYGCHNLEYIDPEMFKNSELKRIGAMFYNCENLLNVPIEPENIAEDTYIMRDSSFDAYMFGYCNSIDTEAVMKFYDLHIAEGEHLIIEMDREEFVGGHVVIGDKLSGMFSRCNVRVLNLSKTVFMYEDEKELSSSHKFDGIIDLFNKRYETNYGMYLDNKKKYLSKVPEIIIVNRSMKINALDSKIFDIVKMEGATKDDIDSMISKYKMFNPGNKLVVIV